MLSLNQKISGSFLFSWHVDARGYEILNTRLYPVPLPNSESETITEPPFILQTSNEFREYVPFKEPRLNRVFADLDSQESVLNFANKYGLLGKVKLLPDKEGEGQWGQTLAEWQREIAEMNAIMGIWDLIYSGTAQAIEKLKKIIVPYLGPSRKFLNMQIRFHEMWNDKQLSFYSNGLSNDQFSNMAIFKDLLDYNERWKNDEIIEPTLVFLARFLNNKIKHQTDVELQVDRVNKALPFLQIYLKPSTLLDALWLMCLLEITGNSRLSRCRYCGTWFEQAHALRMYCSNSCKQADYRKRIKATIA